MRIAFLSSEVVPFAKTGGLADVTGSLPKFLAKFGLELKVFMPFYREVKRKNIALNMIIENQELGWQGRKERFSIWEEGQGLFPAYFIEKDNYYDRDCLYGTPAGDYADNGERFAFFSRASLEALKKMEFTPDILHCHDWQSAISLAYLKFHFGQDSLFKRTRSLFTIHNLAYQGLFDKEILAKIGLPDYLYNMEDLEFYGKVNYLKAGILYSTAISTVSPRYSQEIQTPEFGCGLDGLLKKRSHALHGILNGVDYSDWDPLTDRFIAKNYSPSDLGGKKECKADLLESFKLPLSSQDIPVVGMVSRLAGQKGLDLVCKALKDIFKMDIYLTILGTGEEKIQNALLAMQKKYPSSFGLKIAFDESLAHKINAGSDVFLIPSRYEPCGLTQMYSLKYGTIPVARATGGLDNSIQEFEPEGNTGNGFKFEDYSPRALLASLAKCVSFYNRRDKWEILIKNAMSSDFSWEKSAQEYFTLYKRISAE